MTDGLSRPFPKEDIQGPEPGSWCSVPLPFGEMQMRATMTHLATPSEGLKLRSQGGPGGRTAGAPGPEGQAGAPPSATGGDWGRAQTFPGDDAQRKAEAPDTVAENFRCHTHNAAT